MQQNWKSLGMYMSTALTWNKQIMQDEKRPLKDYNSTQHPMPKSLLIASVEEVEVISQIINNLSSSDNIQLSLLGLRKCCYCLHPCLYLSFAFGQFLALQ